MELVSFKGEYDFILLIAIVLAMVIMSVVVSLFNPNTKEEYYSFNRPKFAPPAILFKIIWIILYILMAWSFYRIILITNTGENTVIQLTLFISQLIINYLWSFIFFKFRKRKLALFSIVILILLVIALIVSLFKVDILAAILLIPYLIWLLFAFVLLVDIIKKIKKD
ncbi:tryptophan-rich sensory protein [Clostridium bornimense]|uniref:TspO/MBR family protein n=1 Tax=Clostridium bornimense TaxID=1216932 RepID=UPI001C11A492|nr:tryptophan-rich sensory protein [Clostridium bornimense]